MEWEAELNKQKAQPHPCTTKFNNERQRQMAN
jgi:hypothetical protein